MREMAERAFCVLAALSAMLARDVSVEVAFDGEPLALVQVGQKRVLRRPPVTVTDEVGQALAAGSAEVAATRLEPWPLFPRGQAPGERPGMFGPEAFVPAVLDDPVALRCCPGDSSGRWYYNVTEPELHPFLVDRHSPLFRGAAVVIAPGGGFSFLAWEKEGTDIVAWLNSLGISAFVLKYRVPRREWLPLGESQLTDAQRAVSMVRFHAPRLGLDPARVGFMGFSAGGFVTAMVANSGTRAYARVDEIDDLGPRPDFTLFIYGVGNPLQVSTESPPAFVAVAEDDQCVPAASNLAYYAALASKGVTADLHIYHNGRHGYGRCTMYTENSRWYDVCLWPTNAKYFLQSTVLGMNVTLPAKTVW